jgi:hypothetical protein
VVEFLQGSTIRKLTGSQTGLRQPNCRRIARSATHPAGS